MQNQQRLNLLTKEEIHILYSLPEFTDVERQHYFSLPDLILKQLKLKECNYNKTSTKLYFILQFGYFKAKNLFFKFQYKDLRSDISFIMKNYLPNDNLPKNLPTKKQRAKIKRDILAYFGFQNKIKETHNLILKKTSILVKSTIDPHATCVDVINYLREQKTVLPSYSRLQDIIGEGLKKEEIRLTRITKKHLSKKIKKAINNLLKIEDVFYKITELKFDPKCFKKQEMSIEIDKLETCILIFNFSKTFLPKTKISRQNVEYYADLAKLYTVNRLQRISIGLSSFYLICYVNQRCARIIDNLIKGFIYYVDKYNANAEQYAKENLLKFQSDLEKHTEPIGHLLELYTDDELMKLSGKKIQKKAFKIMPKENILKLSECLLNSTATRNELKTKLIWEYHKENYRLILNNLRPLFLAIDFASEPELNSLLEALRGAASIISDKLEKLPIFDLHNLSGKRHGSIDGTKKKTRRRTIKTRHSPKYFGLDVGIVIMTMTLNNVPFISEIIGANEHESHFSYPMLFNNNTAIDPHIISTDTAGTNNVNDFLFFLIGKTHAACYRSIADKTKTICGFKSLSHYSEYMIKPTKVANKNLVKKNWSELLPILVALLSHETDQQIIIKKLSSHDYKNEVKEALWELNSILKSVHILKYIDDPNYRRDIRIALNRGEAGNKIINKVMSVGNGDFRGMTDLEVEIWNECNRLIILVILYYNASILSKLYEIKKAAGDNDAIEILRHISFAATQHINLDGLYSFSEAMADIDIDNVVSILNKILDDTIKSKK